MGNDFDEIKNNLLYPSTPSPNKSDTIVKLTKMHRIFPWKKAWINMYLKTGKNLI